MKWLSALLLVLSPIVFVLGVSLPLVTFEKLIFFEESPSLIGIIGALADNGDYALALLVGLFSIVFPGVKMLVVAAEALTAPGEASGWLARLLPLLAKWSMMDVMLVALVIAGAKTSGLANAFTEPGLWCYAVAAFMTTLLSWMLGRRRRA
jgi:paraquat-inducible protein A